MRKPLDENVEKMLFAAVSGQEKPKSVLSVSDATAERYRADKDCIDRIDWDHLCVDDLSPIYELSTFISRDAYLYLVPRIYRLLRLEGGAALHIDFVNVFMCVPYIASDDFVAGLSVDQRASIELFVSSVESAFDVVFRED